MDVVTFNYFAKGSFLRPRPQDRRPTRAHSNHSVPLWIRTGLFCVFLTGCSRNIAEIPSPAAAIPTSSDIFASLADAVDSKGGRTITGQYQLAQVVLVLANSSVLSASDAIKFDTQFPDATKQAKDRELTDDDASKLRGIK